MLTIPERFHEPLQLAAQDLMELLQAKAEEDVKLVQKGLLLFRQKHVYRLRFEQNKISATVQDVVPAKVQLNLDFIQLSECSCPADGFCRHELAVFFHLLAKVKSVTDWVEKWRKPLKESSAAKQLNIQTARDLLKSKEKLKPDYDQWVSVFTDSFHTIMDERGQLKPHTIPERFKAYAERWKARAPFEQEWKLLYQLAGYVYSFKNLMELSAKQSHSHDTIYHYYGHLFHEMMDETVDIMNKLSVRSLPFAFDEFIGKLKDDSSSLLTANFFLEHERVHLYRLLWSNFFRKKAWCEKEKQKLTAITERTLPLTIGIAHLNILLKEDKTALEAISSLNNEKIPYMPYWIDFFTSQREWKRLGPYAEMFIKELKSYLSETDDYYTNRSYANLAINAIRPYCSETGRSDLFEKALIAALPYSYNEYEYNLVYNQKFDKWSQLQAYMGYGIDMVHNERITEISKHSPANLLPLYHQTIEEHINMRTRDHYREAVQEMKKLHSLYKKLNRLADWEYFLEMLLEKTKRLRAFQEECQRGKLIDG